MSGREGRVRPRRDYLTRSEEKAHHGRGNNHPSRHLWVGNLPHDLAESALARIFLQFGELDSVAFQPGRSYAFINYINDEGAFSAIRELQGFVLAGNPLKIEFAKAEKSVITPRDADYSHGQRREEPRPMARGSTLIQRDFKARRSSPETHVDKSNVNDKDGEPSEELWIGFPAELKVDEFILRKAFAPFGEIEKITVPGQTYAFVRFKNVMSACRAKDTLQGKLFGHRRVRICFAKSQPGSYKDWNSTDGSPSPNFGAYEWPGASEHLRADRRYNGDMPGETSIRSHFHPGDSDAIGFGRKTSTWVGEERRIFSDQGSDFGPSRNIYQHRDSPSRDRGSHFREYTPNFPREDPNHDDPWDLPEDSSFFHGRKKLKITSFPPENELPEYPFYDLGKPKPAMSRIYPDLTQAEVVDKDFDSKPIGSRAVHDVSLSSIQPYRERNVPWDASRDKLSSSSVPLIPTDRKRLTPELHEPSPNKEWKWEGTIAKGGNPVCRARCFPVGKPMDIIIPQYLDCTARTSLEMLAKHYYEAASAWVVFFVPASDPDIAFYNEFMNYLGEKQRAAVAKLDEKATMFLVPPSEFSEKVLKVPGRMSISGVVLRLEPPGSSYGQLQQNEKIDTFTSFHGQTLHQKPISPSGLYLPTHPSRNVEPGSSSGALAASFPGSGILLNNMPEHALAARRDNLLYQPSSAGNWSPPDMQNFTSVTRSNESLAPNSSLSSVVQGYAAVPRSMQETTQSYTAEIVNGKLPLQEKPPISSSMPPTASQVPEQLVQLALSLLGQHAQLAGTSIGEGNRHSWNLNQPGYLFKPEQSHVAASDQISSEFSTAQFAQAQQLQQQTENSSAAAPPSDHTGPHMSQQLQNADQEDTDADPQKRLQATLQLAAALLQQVHQGKAS